MRSNREFIYENFFSPGVDEEEAWLLQDRFVEEEAWLLEVHFMEDGVEDAWLLVEEVLEDEVSFRPWEALATAGGGMLEGPLEEGSSSFCFLAPEQKKQTNRLMTDQETQLHVVEWSDYWFQHWGQ